MTSQLKSLTSWALFSLVVSAYIGLFDTTILANLKHPLPMHITESSVAEVATTQNTIMYLLPQENIVKTGEIFAINVAVENAMDVYAWQIHLDFDPTVLECVNVALPPYYVFSYAITVGFALVEYNSTEFENPLQRIVNNEGWVLTGDSLIGTNQTTLNGSGILCQIEFKAISAGSSSLKLLTNSSLGTYVLNSNLKIIQPLTLTVQST